MDPRYRAILVDELTELDGTGELAMAPIVDELLHALSIELHEGILPTYGALVTVDAEHWEPVFAGSTSSLPLAAIPTGQAADSLLRELADGRSSFFRRHRDGNDLWAADDGKELAEADLADMTADAAVVQLLADGSLRLIGPSIVAERRRNTWQSRPTAGHYRGILTSGEWRFPGPDDVLHAILELCLHRLSPSHIGTTIVWTDCDMAAAACEPLGRLQNSQLPNLSVRLRENHSFLQHLLAQRDGATFVSAQGDATRTSMRLLGASSTGLRVENTGARHASAAAYTGRDRAAWIFVVSQDGPLTILHNNRIVADREMILMWEESMVVCEVCEGREGGFGCETCGETGRVQTATRRPVPRLHSHTWI